jgi:N-acyl homoserine lactone hydrolase
MRTIRKVRFATVVTALLLATTAAVALAQSPQGMKLYVFSSGALKIGKNILQNLGPQEEIRIPVGFFVVMHPKGNVLFDTGNNDKIITDPGYWGPFFKSLSPVNTPDVAIDAQLAKIGLKPDDIKYVVVGHMHLDHAGNVAKFPNSTLIVQKDEIRNAFWPEPGTAGPYIPGDVEPLRSGLGEAMPNKYKMIQLNGDMDIFGDSSIVVKRWVGHTPGSQMLVVRLPKTGTIILTSDNVYFRENVEKNILPNVALAYDPPGILRAYEWIRQMQATEKADFFTAHDPDAFKAMKKPPEYYD